MTLALSFTYKTIMVFITKKRLFFVNYMKLLSLFKVTCLQQLRLTPYAQYPTFMKLTLKVTCLLKVQKNMFD